MEFNICEHRMLLTVLRISGRPLMFIRMSLITLHSRVASCNTSPTFEVLLLSLKETCFNCCC